MPTLLVRARLWPGIVAVILMGIVPLAPAAAYARRYAFAQALQFVIFAVAGPALLAWAHHRRTRPTLLTSAVRCFLSSVKAGRSAWACHARGLRWLAEIATGARVVFHHLDGAEKGAEAGFVALGIRVEQPLDGRSAVGLFFRLDGLGQGQLRPDIEFELV